MAAPKNTRKVDREAQVEEVGRLTRRGYRASEIARMLGVSAPQVIYDQKIIYARYRERTVATHAESVAEKIEQLEEVRKVAWEAYERSQKDFKKVVREMVALEEEDQKPEKPARPNPRHGVRNGKSKQPEDPPPKKYLDKLTGKAGEALKLLKMIRTQEGRLPANAYLDTILRTLEIECKLRGLNEPTKVDLTSGGLTWEEVLSRPVESNPIKARLDEARQLPAPEGVEGTVELQEGVGWYSRLGDKEGEKS